MKEVDPVLLIRPRPNLRKPDAVEPLTLLGLAAQLEKEGIGVQILDGAVQEITPQDLAEHRIFGVTATTSQYPKALRLLEMFKDLEHESGDHVQSILGGPHVTVFKDQALKDGWTTACAGEGEHVIGDIVRRGLTGLVQGQRVNDLDTLPIPNRRILGQKRYIREEMNEPSISIMGMRGCPYVCIYCARELTGRNVRFRSPGNIATEIEQVVRKHGITQVVFYDDTFTLNKKRTLDLCGELGKLNITWICNTRVDLVDPEVLAAMKKTGCAEISFGLESANQKVLDFAKKETTPEQAVQAVQMTKDAGIVTRVFFMFGFPEDSWESVNDNLEFLEIAQPDRARLSLLVPLPGSELFDRADEFGLTLTSNHNLYYFSGPSGPHTFIERTRHLDERSFQDAQDTLQQGFVSWATKKNPGSAHVTNVRI